MNTTESKLLLRAFTDSSYTFISEKEKQEIVEKQACLGKKIEDMAYEDWNYVLSPIKDYTIRNSNLMLVKKILGLKSITHLK